jgi:hypothetical protein
MKWQDGRNPDERLVDRALVLLAVGFGERAGRIDHFRLMKIPFAVQHELNAKGVKSFSYRFYRDDHGPISKAIYEDRDVLRDSGLLEGDEKSLHLTKLGDRLFRVITAHLVKGRHNQAVVDVLKSKAERYASLPSWEAIKGEVYELEVDAEGTPTTIREAPAYADVLSKLTPSAASARVVLPESLVFTLRLAFSLTPDEIEAGDRDSGLTLDEVFAPR